MPNPIYPGAMWRPGRNAGYASGHSTMRAAICHQTIGRDSSGIGMRGYFTWLVSRDGSIQQYCEADAVCWHAGTANPVGPGIEIEYLPGADDTVFTPAALAACSGLIHWLEQEWDIPLEYYDGPRIPASRMRGFISHRSVQQPDAHSDWWPQEDWDAMTSGTQPVPPPDQGAADGMWGLLALHGTTSTYMGGIGSAVLVDVNGEQRDFGFPMDQLKFVGWDPFKVTFQIVAPGTVENVRELWPNVGV